MLPPGLLDNYKYFIAGGYAVCPALADDIDVWVQCQPSRIEDVRDELRAFFRKEYKKRFVAETSSETVASLDGNGYNTLVRTEKVGKVKPFTCNKQIHVLVTDETVESVLNSFDISTCRVALLPNGNVITGAGWTPVNEPPVVLRMTDSTPARLEKYRRRFGFAQTQEATV